MAKKDKKNLKSTKKEDNSKFLIMGMVGVIVLIFVVMFSAILNNDTPAGSNNSSTNSNRELDQVMDRIETREARLANNPDDLSLLENLGYDYHDAGSINMFQLNDEKQGIFMYEQAMYYYSRVLEQDPDNFDVRTNMATVAWRVSPIHYDLADEYFNMAFEQEGNPKMIIARGNYGNFLYFAKEDLEGAVEQWEIALELNPSVAQRDQFNNLIAEANKRLGIE